MSEKAIELKNVRKVYQLGKIELTVLKGVSLDISRGDFVSIMGPSGSGKSTLLNMVGCLDVPTKGKVILNGKDVSELTEDQLSQLRGKTIGFVFQEFNLMAHLTAIENVMLPMVFQGKTLKQRKKRARELLVSVGLEKRINHQPSELSGGEKQRVAIARAFANNPEIVIADEPTGNLDSVTGDKIMEVLKMFHQKEKKTIIVVTHDPNIAGYSEKIFQIKDGEIVTNHQKVAKFLWKK